MKKALIVSTVSRQFYLFEKCNIEVLQSLGYEVHAAANFSDANGRLLEVPVIRHPLGIRRSPFSARNIAAYRQLKRLMLSQEFSLVHCHSPMGGVLARLAANSAGVSPVIYTAHGFHFYKGAPVVNWLLYYPVERMLARITDMLITINREDFHRARRFKGKNSSYVPGIGIDTEKFQNQQICRNTKRDELRLPRDAIVLLSVGELNRNKNHETMIRALAMINDPSIHYAVCGQGPLEGCLRHLARKLGVEDRLHLLGYRNDLPEVYHSADIFLLPSYREGLSASMLEGMCAGLPMVCSDIRGNRDLIQNGVGGYLVKPGDAGGFAACVMKLAGNEQLCAAMGLRNRDEAKKYCREIVKHEMTALYKACAACRTATKSNTATPTYEAAEYEALDRS